MPVADRTTPKALKRKRKAPERVPPAPTKRHVRQNQVRQAHNQARQYASQGEAVDRSAQTLKRAQRTREHEARDTKGASDLGRAKTYAKTPESQKVRKELREARKQADVRKVLKGKKAGNLDTTEAGSAPVLRVLEQTTRPLHGIAAGTRESVRQLKKGRMPLEPKSLEAVTKAGVKGLKNEDKSTFSDVLKDVGAPKAVRAPAGFALDVAADPTTYVTFGAGGVARRAAQQAGKQAQKKALAKGLTSDQASRFAKRAEHKVLSSKPDAKGAVVKFAGREAPGVRKATAVAAKPLTKATRATGATKAGRGLRNAAADVRPSIHRTDVSRESHEAIREAARRARSKKVQGEREAVALGEGIRKQIGPESYAKVVDAIEAGKIRKLPDELHQPARQLRDTTRYLNRTRKRAGIQGGEIKARKGRPDQPKEYVPRQLSPAALAEITKPDARGVARSGASSPLKRRTEKRRLAIVREEHPGRYREDIDALYAQRYAQGAKSTAQADLNRAIANEAKPVKRGDESLTLASLAPEGKAVFHIKGSQPPRRVTDEKELARATNALRPNKRGTKLKGATPKSVGAGRYVVAREKDVADAMESAEPKLKSGAGGILSAYDKAQGGFKSIALATPGYHVRNLIGDTAQAYTAQPGHKLPGSLRQAGRLAHEMTRQDKARRELRIAEPSGKTLKTKQYGHVPLEEAVDRLVKAGAARSGFTSRELRELTSTDAPGKLRKSAQRVKATKAGQGASRLVLNREDLPRLATAVAALQKGATWDEAAKRVADTHFDYCVDEATEVLTERGWLTLDEVTTSDQALALDPISREIQWAPISAVNVFPAQAREMVQWKSTVFNALSTPAHRWLAAGSGFRGGHHSLPRDAEHFTTTQQVTEKFSRLIIGGGKPLDGSAILSDTLVELLGWYVAEGWTGRWGGVLVAQSARRNPGYVERIRALANALKDEATVTEYAPRDMGWGPIITWYFGGGVGEQIRALCPDKQLPMELLTKLSASQRELLLSTLIAADGHRNSKGTEVFAQKDLGRVDSFQALAAMVGRRTYARPGEGATAITVYRASRNHVLSSGLRHQRETYQGRVWCPTTSTGTWMARRHGVTYWTGNSDLSSFERNVARRIMPFYTWSSRNIPYQAKTIVKRPGKYANFQKLREEAAKAIGADEIDNDTKRLYKDLEQAGVQMPGGWERYVSQWEQRNAPVPVSWKGSKFTVSMGLPVADLNEFPGAALSKQLDEYYQKGMSLAGPMPKNLIEYFDNHSFFFRDQLERDHSPLVPAPEWAKLLPKPLQKAAALTDQHVDKKTGKKILAWRGKADYVFKSVPGTPQFLQQLSIKAPGSQGRSKVQKLLGWAGLKVTPTDARRIAVNAAYGRLDEIEKRINLIKEDPAKAAEVARLKGQRKVAQRIAYAGRAQQGYKVLPKQGKPSTRVSKGGFADGQSSGGFVGSSGSGGFVE